MTKIGRKALVLAAILTTVAAATSAVADGRPGLRVSRGSHAPIFVRSARVRSVITPYYVGYYPGHYSYNSPGPVFERLTFYHPLNSCWIWRYNYLYWTC
jgi:hypothetical protein